jgi:hypothetical protein
VAWSKIVEVIKHHGKTIAIGFSVLICVIWAWNSIGGLLNHGTTDNGSRVEIERSSDRQQLINESADEIEQRLETSTNATERIEQSNSDIKATIDRIEERSREGETILERDQRLIEECRNILADIRRQGQVER